MDVARVRLFRAPLFWVAVLAWLAAGCAQVGTPSGGPKDETPPQLLGAQPPVGSTDVRPTSLTLTFDEYVKAGQWRSQLLVSPPIDGAMDLIVRGREIELTWDGDLRDSTTYVVQFGDGIADVNEGNAAMNLIHAFATGSQLDTLSIQGAVRDAQEGTSQANMRVLLYGANLPLDSIHAGASPQYVGVTDKDGHFEVGYLPAEAFRVLAIDDENRNYRWDAGERAALGPETAQAGDTTLHVMRAGDTPGPRAPYLSEASRDSTGWASWKLSETVQPGDSLSWGTATDLVLMPVEGDRVQAWGWSEALDSVALQVVWHHAPDWPQGEWTTDTLDVPQPRMKPAKDLALTGKPLGKQRPGQQPKLTWSAALEGVNEEKWTVTVDSLPVAPDLQAAWPSTQVALHASALHRPGAQIALTVLPGALIRQGRPDEVLPVDTLELVWSVLPLDALSEWTLHLEGVACPGLVELTNAKGERLDVVPVRTDTTLTWTHVMPGKVRATWWGDPDGDEVWRNVDPLTWRKPEPVVRMEPVELRANWVMESTWPLDSAACDVP